MAHDARPAPPAAPAPGSALQPSSPGALWWIGGLPPLLLAAILMAPALVLVWPLPSILPAADPLPLETARGLALLTALPGVLLLIALGRRPRWTRGTLVLVAVIVGAAALGARGATDTFALRGALLQYGILAYGALVGASLHRAERRAAARLAAAIAVAAMLPALAGFVTSGGSAALAGFLGNSGATSQVALVGAVAGSWLGLTRRGPWRLVGLAAFLTFGVHAVRTPVLAGCVALVAVLAVLAVCSPWSQELHRLRSALGAMAGIVLFAAIVGRTGAGALPEQEVVASAAAELGRPQQVPIEKLIDRGPPAASEADAGSTEDGALGDLGGVGVRLSVWRASAALAAEAGPFGTGPGQFAARFPPHRDPAEIALSQSTAGPGQETEVDHPHNDLAQGVIEFGWVGGAAWLGLLGLGLWRCLATIGDREVARTALAAGGLAMLVAGLAHSGLSTNAPAGLLGGLCLGVALRRQVPSIDRTSNIERGPGRSAVTWAALVVWVLLVPAAASRVQHGRALSATLSAGLEAVPVGPSQAAALERALDAEPHSPLALALGARTLQATQPELAAARWEELLAVRPHSVEALIQSGVLAGSSGRTEFAAERFARALELEPDHPAARHNLEFARGRLAARAADVGSGDAGAASLTPERLELVLAQLRGLRPPLELAAELGLEAPFGRGLAESVDALAAEARSAERELEYAALQSLAHHLWAREHAQLQDFSTAVRSYRQAAAYARRGARTADLTPLDSPLIVQELAAALRLAGQPAEAATLLEDTPPTPLSPHLPPFARAELAD